MKTNKFFKIFVIIALFSLALAISASAETDKRIARSWELPEYQTIVTFFDDGTGIVNGIETFRWEIDEAFIDIFPFCLISKTSPVRYLYTISRDGSELTLKDMEAGFGEGAITFTVL